MGFRKQQVSFEHICKWLQLGVTLLSFAELTAKLTKLVLKSQSRYDRTLHERRMQGRAKTHINAFQVNLVQ